MLAQDSREVSSLCCWGGIRLCEAGAVACMFDHTQAIERASRLTLRQEIHIG